MANAQFDFGFEAVDHLCGGEIRPREYILTTGQIVYKGDVVLLASTGTVTSTTSATTVPLGVAAEYVDDSDSVGGKKILVYDDPFIVFKANIRDSTATTEIAAADIGQNVILTATAGTAASAPLSKMLLDANGHNTTNTILFRLIGKLDQPDNDWGKNCKVLVVFNQHFYKAGMTAQTFTGI